MDWFWSVSPWEIKSHFKEFFMNKSILKGLFESRKQKNNKTRVAWDIRLLITPLYKVFKKRQKVSKALDTLIKVWLVDSLC